MEYQTLTAKNYSKPPITEAVIELRLANSFDLTKLESFVFRQKSKFNIETLSEHEVKIPTQSAIDSSLETKTRFLGFRLIEISDTSNIILLKTNAISISRLPPYEGWEKLNLSLKQNLKFFFGKKIFPLNRIGVRFINRIDVPEGEKFRLEDYLKVYPHVPEKKYPNLNNFLVHTRSDLDDIGSLTVNVSNVDSPLLNHSGILLDIDVAQYMQMPKNEKELTGSLDKMRIVKNYYFENLITQKTKRLFK